ncbi:hypothetical protein CDAR_73641 [Caerostris darwini]|uniref:Uncharacterized protein n=1 Tax=Caerostris darwini TaxID=1538125 RepID=A0AAV4MQY6_9ARAC|nr:hypothetical protein CDAR_73641 [Caerostris darwini]
MRAFADGRGVEKGGCTTNSHHTTLQGYILVLPSIPLSAKIAPNLLFHCLLSSSIIEERKFPRMQTRSLWPPLPRSLKSFGKFQMARGGNGKGGKKYAKLQQPLQLPWSAKIDHRDSAPMGQTHSE